jgi:hypothetical protein
MKKYYKIENPEKLIMPNRVISKLFNESNINYTFS